MAIKIIGVPKIPRLNMNILCEYIHKRVYFNKVNFDDLFLVIADPENLGNQNSFKLETPYGFLPCFFEPTAKVTRLVNHKVYPYPSELRKTKGISAVEPSKIITV